MTKMSPTQNWVLHRHLQPATTSTTHNLSIQNYQSYLTMIIRTCQWQRQSRQRVTTTWYHTVGELDPNGTPAKRALGLLAKDPIAEQMSMDSSHSDDFTDPFMLPHKIKFGDSSSRECQSDNHTYKCLDLSTIEPDQNYTVPTATKHKRKRKGHNQSLHHVSA